MIGPTVLEDALRSLLGPPMAFADAERLVPDVPGLYAFYGGPDAWRQLGLGDPPDGRPLYVGKAERSLAARDIRTHFATGRTGSSTVRRSIAGLMAEVLDLRGQPRNVDNPEGFSNFGLEAAGDERLTEWMIDHLGLAAWPAQGGVDLEEIETAILARLLPPLNIDKVRSRWRDQVRSGRKRLADQARSWRPEPLADKAPTCGSGPSATGRALGIDAAGKHGWVGIVLDETGFLEAQRGSLRDLLAWAEPVDAIGIDIPIGQVRGGERRADVEARRFVGPRRSSVFPAPPAEALAASSYAAANAELAAIGAPLLSRQAWALVPKVLEAAEVGSCDARVHEVHPEVSFCELAGEHLPWPKKSWNGLFLRRRLLASAGIDVPEVIDELAGVAADDVVDAAIAAWSARRIATGVARSLPDPGEEPGGGRPVAIWR